MGIALVLLLRYVQAEVNFALPFTSQSVKSSLFSRVKSAVNYQKNLPLPFRCLAFHKPHLELCSTCWLRRCWVYIPPGGGHIVVSPSVLLSYILVFAFAEWQAQTLTSYLINSIMSLMADWRCYTSCKMKKKRNKTLRTVEELLSLLIRDYPGDNRTGLEMHLFLHIHRDFWNNPRFNDVKISLSS